MKPFSETAIRQTTAAHEDLYLEYFPKLANRRKVSWKECDPHASGTPDYIDCHVILAGGEVVEYARGWSVLDITKPKHVAILERNQALILETVQKQLELGATEEVLK